MVASFDGGAITSDAGALLLGQTDRAISLSERFAACFSDTRSAGLVEHQVETMVMQRGAALVHECPGLGPRAFQLAREGQSRRSILNPTRTRRPNPYL